MKLISKTIINIAIVASTGWFTSCNYLDVVPPEQPNLPHAMSSNERALGFLYSCYAGTDVDLPAAYLGEVNSSTDEYTLPWGWNEGYWDDYATNTVTPIKQNWVWGTTYKYIGQCLLFLNELDKVKADYISDAERKQWKAEAKFLIAYYHFATLRRYGPIPITDSYVPQNTSPSQYNGRMHFDYCVDWIAKELDEAAKDLPAKRVQSQEWGRATSTICKAVKARLMLYAASPLWNGSFPFPEWKNKNFETPGYGKELVSHSYDEGKWRKALEANLEALQLATGEGARQLYNDEEYYQRQQLKLPYVPGISDGDMEEAEKERFLKTVMKMRYAVSTRENEGNHEIIWGLSNGFYVEPFFPLRIVKTTSGNWESGWSGISPTLYTIEHFYTSRGKLPAKDPEFAPETEWLKSAGLGNGRGDIIKLNVGREPRFYAWMAFDGGDYGSRIKAGEPLKLELHNPQMQGYNPDLFNRDHSVTGFLCQKYIDPMTEYYATGNRTTGTSAPTILFRLAELYLNVAECYAALGQTDKAIEYLNPIRRRAGIPELTAADVTKDMTITEWVRNERFVELWDEAHRFYDVRRWMQGEKFFGAGKMEGLNAEVVGPTFEEFNKRTKVKIPVTWNNRMYLNPVFYNEVYKNPQMVQAPGY
ncbi:MAG: RagB/SusD family nutrient uptake outer membrane protein [Prevotella sp.]|nr:RagB/SusD family nutrient uptake outer membrane protein [Prevotella sp.]MDY6130890.1 RagB/SusD family nutrient uptake outer membrane protein [Prevotella sp.]